MTKFRQASALVRSGVTMRINFLICIPIPRHPSTMTSKPAGKPTKKRPRLEDVETLLSLGQDEEIQDRTLEAVAYYKKAIDNFPSSASANFAYAQALLTLASEATQLDQVRLHIERAIEENDAEEEPMLDSMAKSILALLLIQQGKTQEAEGMLKEELGIGVMISPSILRYPLKGKGLPTAEMANVQLRDGVLTTRALGALQEGFKRESIFWKEHEYFDPRTGYFSYLYKLSDDPSTVIEEIIHTVWGFVKESFPEERTQNVTIAEWWAHSRPHSSGHQLHFDTDEARIKNREGVHSPAVSCVLYLSGEVGGPTLVIEQKFGEGGGGGSSAGGLVYPEENRLLMFDGRLLHGVIPGRGPSPDALSRRLTLMIGFWEQMTPYTNTTTTATTTTVNTTAANKSVALEGSPRIFGPGMLPPDKDSCMKWPTIFPKLGERGRGQGEKVLPFAVSPVWKDLGPSNSSNNNDNERNICSDTTRFFLRRCEDIDDEIRRIEWGGWGLQELKGLLEDIQEGEEADINRDHVHTWVKAVNGGSGERKRLLLELLGEVAASEEEKKSWVVEAGGVEILINAMERGEEEEVRSSAAAALSIVVDGCHHAQEKVEKHPLFFELLEGLLEEGEGGEMIEGGLLLLWNVLKFSDGKEERSLVEAAKKCVKEGEREIKALATGVLSFWLEKEGVVQAIAEGRGVEALIEDLSEVIEKGQEGGELEDREAALRRCVQAIEGGGGGRGKHLEKMLKKLPKKVRVKILPS